MQSVNLFRDLRFWLVVAIVIYPPLLIWQWGDFTDSGFHAYRVQNFAADAAGGRLESSTLLTNLIGAFWWSNLAASGLLGLFALGALFVVVSSFAPLYALEPGKAFAKPALAAILAAQAFYVRGWLHFDYDVVSGLFVLWAAAFLVHGAITARPSLFFLSGILIACAAYARVPSFLAVTLVCVLFIPLLSQKDGQSRWRIAREWRDAIRGTLLVGAGMATCFALGALLLSVSGWFGPYLEGLARLAGEGKSSGSHNLGALLGKTLMDARALVWPWGVLALLWLFAACIALNRKTPRWVGVVFVVSTLCALVVSIALDPVPSYDHPIRSAFPAAVLIVCALFLCGVLPSSDKLRMCMVAGVIVVGASVAGSNTGLLKVGPGMLFLLPACVLGLWQAASLSGSFFSNVRWERLAVALVLMVLVGSVASRCFAVYQASNHWFDRLLFTHRSDVPVLRGLRMTDERARFLEKAYKELAACPQEMGLFVFGHSPILYFVSGRRPYVEEAWQADRKFTPAEFIASISRRAAATGQLPVVAVTERGRFGPAGWAEMESFLKENGYSQRSRDPGFGRYAFELYLPPSRLP